MGTAAIGPLAVGEFAIIFVLPLYLVNALGLDVMGAGLVLAAMAAGAFLSGAAARHLAARFGAPGTVLIGLGLEVAGVVVLALLLGPDASGWLGAGHRGRRGHHLHRPGRHAARGPGRRRPHRPGGRLARLGHAGLGRHHDPAAAHAGEARPARGAHGGRRGCADGGLR
ncbi:hypothetical protein [Micrococcus flavus]|uniref:Major facilitator superfamily (MFS) profile domain-containing protein n=1 Tax=Micrococcus flavus TaxID=384602 RepID=A0A7W7L3I0_9MICC|nr:hypothetical protein [Micrococcus flavus]MBB4882894.1 hypothetical protein [Micrococcus flavus]GGK40846.1 hypothetical protein GCM10007073_04720 [Micrococcus flavus]